MRHIDFDAEQPDLDRALKQGIVAEQLAPGEYSVLSSNGVDTYKISHNMCTCTGYWRWHKCKHIALVHTLMQQNGDAIICDYCGLWLIVQPPMSVEEYEHLHDD
jgi:hypothetical protein